MLKGRLNATQEQYVLSVPFNVVAGPLPLQPPWQWLSVFLLPVHY